MTDFSVTAEQFAGLTPDGQASLEASLSKAGASAEYLASIKGGKTAAPTAKSAAAAPFGLGGPRPAPDPQHVPLPTAAGHLGYETKVTAFQKLREAGVADATLQPAAKAEGVPWNEIAKDGTAAAEPVPLTLAEANAKLQAVGDPALAPGNSPVDYDFTLAREDIEGLDAQEVATISRLFKDAFFEAKLPMASAQSIVRESMATINRLDGLSDAARELDMKEQGDILRRSGNIDEINRYVELALSRLPANFKTKMFAIHAFSSADAYASLAAAGRLIEARETRAKK